MGLVGTDWELDFKQCSFHHIMQVLRVCRFSTFTLPPAFPPCCCPLAFQHQVRQLTSRMSSESYPGYPECVVSYHGADRMTNRIRAITLHAEEACQTVTFLRRYTNINSVQSGQHSTVPSSDQTKAPIGPSCGITNTVLPLHAAAKLIAEL
jgi:hypothetical protein